METAYAEDVFEHQGGWDEILYALGPIALIFGLLRLATVRARRANRQKAATGSDGAENTAVDATNATSGDTATTQSPTHD